MRSSEVDAPHYWGYLVEHDKRPSPLLQQLLLGIAKYVEEQVTPRQIRCLSPVKLAAFYRMVGANYDDLFLRTPSQQLSFVYRSLGCFHTLQPTMDPFEAPSIPALTPLGFIRWQTIQLLLTPEDHVPVLQKAVKRLPIWNLGEGGPFPRFLPSEALPLRADKELTKWYESVSNILETEVDKALELQKTSTNEGSSGIHESSIEGESSANATGYFDFPPKSTAPRHSDVPPVVVHSAGPRHPSNLQDDLTQSPEIRRRSYPHHDQRSPRDAPTPTGKSHSYFPRGNGRSRSPSGSSGSETGDELRSASEASVSPAPRHQRRNRLPHPSDGYGRRHSAHDRYNAREYGQHLHPRRGNTISGNTLSPQFHSRANSLRPEPHSAPLQATSYNVRFRDMSNAYSTLSTAPNTAPSTPSGYQNMRFEDTGYSKARPADADKATFEERMRTRQPIGSGRDSSGRA